MNPPISDRNSQRLKSGYDRACLEGMLPTAKLEFDRAFVTLIEDLEQRGMLEHTLVVVTGEMGRTPQINNLGGRDHWGRAWSVAMAGCGIRKGVVFGKTNDTGTEVKEDEVSIGDLFHTYLKALRLNPNASYQLGGQTNPVADPSGKAIKAVLA